MVTFSEQSRLTMAAHEIPAGEVPAEAPQFNPAILLDSEGHLAWVPELVIGVELPETWSPELRQAISRRVRRLQLDYHPDRQTDRPELAT